MPFASSVQRRAMFAAASGKSNIGIPAKVARKFIAHDAGVRGASTMFTTPDGRVLFLRRKNGVWDLPGGHAEEGEEPADTAQREAREEVGAWPSNTLDLTDRNEEGGADFFMFRAPVKFAFTPNLKSNPDKEHDGHEWASLDKLPSPLMPEVAAAIARAVETKRALAGDAEHWISTESGSHLLIEGNGSGGYTVKGGAGGKLDGTTVSPHSMSENRINAKTSQFNRSDFKPTETKERAPETTRKAAFENAAASSAKTYLNVPFSDKDYAKKHGAFWDKDKRKWFVAGDVPKELAQYDKPRSRDIPESERTYLHVPYEDREKAKAAGARWNPDRKQWFVQGDVPETLNAYRNTNSAEAKAYGRDVRWNKMHVGITPEFKRLEEKYRDKPALLGKVKQHREYIESRSPEWWAERSSKSTQDILKETGRELFGSQKESGSATPKKQSAPARKLPTSGHIDESDPSVYGHELLGHEGESWSRFLSSEAGQRMMERMGLAKKTESKTGGEPEHGWAYSQEAVNRALRGADAADDPEAGWDDPANYAEDEQGLNERERSEADRNDAEREKMPASAFLEGASRKYPIKVKRDGQWIYDRGLLIAAAQEARVHGHESLAQRADEIRSREFGKSANDAMAFDEASVRSFDQDGRLHIAITHISKANVCPYRGDEIPDWQEHGLDADHVYMLLRDPQELEKAVSTANNIPLMSEHVPVSVDDPQKRLVIGATGSDAEFDSPYLDNSLVVWDADAIKAIEDGSQKEISCSYYYTLDKTPGRYQGVSYDGIIRNIKFNHVAIVPTGRVGPDVAVGDSALNLTGAKSMGNKSLVKRAIGAKGALLAFLKPKLANDADIGDVVDFIDALNDPDKGEKQQTEDADPRVEHVLELVRGKVSDEDLQAIRSAMESEFGAAKDEIDDEGKGKAKDEPVQTPGAAKADPGKEAAKIDDGTDEERQAREKQEAQKAEMQKRASDAALVSRAKKEAMQQFRDIASAEDEVRPYVGKLAAMDSASDIYKAALKLMNVDVAGVHPSAYRAILLAHPKPDAQHHVAMDSAETVPGDVADVFPDLARLR